MSKEAVIFGIVVIAYFAGAIWLTYFGYEIMTAWMYIEPYYTLGGFAVSAVGVLGIIHGIEEVKEGFQS